MSSPESKPTPKQAARRKLLRGAFSAPAVMTVYSGNALAASSSLRCLAYQTDVNSTSNKTGNGVISTSNTDGWLRVPLYRTGSGTTASPYKYYVKGSDITAFQKPGRSCIIASNEIQQYSKSSNSLASGTKMLSSALGAPTLTSGCGEFVCVQFNATGDIVACGANLTGSSAMPSTCWASVYASL